MNPALDTITCIMAELPLDDDQRHALASELDGVRVAKLVGREAPPNARLGGGPAQAGAGGRTRPASTARLTVDDAQQRPDGQLDPDVEPRLQFVPAPGVHADLAPAAALAAPDEQRAAALVKIGLGERERFVDAQPCAPQDDDQRAEPAAVRIATGGAHRSDDFLDLGRIGG